MLNQKGWFSPEALPLVSTYAGVAPSDVLNVAGHQRELEIATAINRTIRHSDRPDPVAPVAPLRSYQLPQAAYSTLEETRLYVGTPAASVLESYLCGETKSLDGLSADELRIVRAIAEIRGITLPS